MEDGERINQRAFMRNPGTPTTMWGLTWGVERVGLGGGGEREKKWNNCNSINNENK